MNIKHFSTIIDLLYILFNINNNYCHIKKGGLVMFKNFSNKLIYFVVFISGFYVIYDIFNSNETKSLTISVSIFTCFYIGYSFKKFIECFNIKNLDEKFKGINLSLTHNFKEKFFFFFLSFIMSGGFISMFLIFLFYLCFTETKRGK